MSRQEGETGAAAESIELRPGQMHSRQLRGLGTAGYQWVATMDGPSSVARWSVSSIDTEEPDAAVPRPGAPVDHLLTIEGVTPGRVLLRLQHKRPWEMNSGPVDEFVLDIVVTQ